MDNLELMKLLSKSSPTKIIQLVIDGLGGLPLPETGKTELETASTPNLDSLAAKSICGLCDPISPGIISGSAPGHLSLFGYDPLRYCIGRGALEANGIEFDLQPGDVVARGNFCTLDKAGLITDRRAGRISTEQCVELCQLLDGWVLEDIEIIVKPVKDHRFIVVFRGNSLDPDVSDSDPQQLEVAPNDFVALSPEAKKAAGIANQFVTQAKAVLTGQVKANMLLLRGFSQRSHFPTMGEIYKLKPAAIAGYPLYRGLARLIGMDILEIGTSIEAEFKILKQNYESYDFFFWHIKGADSAGEDGDFERKVKVIEQVDKMLPQIIDLQPEVILVSGDHSTPAVLAGHSWHPLPVLLYSKWCRPDRVVVFSEVDCILGGLGRFPSVEIMPLVMANALKLGKFGA